MPPGNAESDSGSLACKNASLIAALQRMLPDRVEKVQIELGA